ncbi:uncharacterized protein F5147DRAFT_659242 [Suillus discolor]|uniref:Uncharacterized protein n=1 Tax=Suillus discolor TaxID=1912936 RepID=A0A9P7ERC9_9AGAM|nr:uncharacterized protein F5147DRAFT_659242 [Suillus discolor]KAG2086322.1 hypothetical protein F5147DRAFT_659242 [Suillus discolor]
MFDYAWPADVAMTTDPPIGYIAMNDHSGPLVEDSRRAEYQVLVPIYGFTQQDDRTLYNVNVISRVLKHNLISVWTWLNRSYDLQLGYLNVIPSPGAHGPFTSPSIPSEDLMQPLGSTSNFSEEKSSSGCGMLYDDCKSVDCTTIQMSLQAQPEMNPYSAHGPIIFPVELVSGTRFHWHHLREQYNHKPNNFASDWHKIIRHCLQPGKLMDFCKNQAKLQTRTSRMLAALNTQLVSDSADYDIIGEIIGLQMAKEIWHHIVLRPVASNPSISIADVYWNQILDQQGDVSLEAITFIAVSSKRVLIGVGMCAHRCQHLTTSTYASHLLSSLSLAEPFKFNLEFTVAELELIEYTLRQVGRNHEALPLLERVQYMRSLPAGTPLGPPLMDDSLSSEDGAFLSVERSFIKCHKFSASVEDFFRQSLASDDGESVDDYFFQGLSANETSLDAEAFEEEDIDVIPDNGNGDEELHSCRHQRRVASRKLRQLNQHPYAPPRGPILPGEPINMRPPGPDPTCPHNGRRLHAAQIWQAQATSIQSASFITSDALIATLTTPHVESTASHLDVRAWVDNANLHQTGSVHG